MAYNGFLLKVAKSNINDGFIIPDKFIQVSSYQVTLATQDVDSYRDANGILHRDSVLSHKVAKIEFNTPYMNSRDFNAIMEKIRAEYTDSTNSNHYRDSVMKSFGAVSVYVPELDGYKTFAKNTDGSKAMYMPDITVQIHKRNADGSFIYEPCRIAFIGY